MKNSSYIKLNELSKTYYNEDKDYVVFENLNLEIEKGSIVSILGKSGCGKTTLLRCICGFEKITNGTVTINDLEVTKPSNKAIMIFQSPDQLFGWQKVKENIITSIKVVKRIKKDEKLDKIVDEILHEVGLYEFKDYYPNRLSGGMKQRAALARAISLDADVLFMDEPFSSLDSFTRRNLQDLVMSISKKRNITIIFVTHSIEEALKISNKIVVMDDEKPCRKLNIYELNSKNNQTIRKKIEGYFNIYEGGKMI